MRPEIHTRTQDDTQPSSASEENEDVGSLIHIYFVNDSENRHFCTETVGETVLINSELNEAHKTLSEC